jgi:hypothetical protein
VVATIEVADESAATGLVSTLQSVSSNATAFGELLGVAVESVEAPLAKSILLAAPVPPPSQPPSGPPQTPPSAPPDLVGYIAAFVSENSDDPVIIGSAVGGVSVLCLCVLLCIFLCCRRRKKRGAVHKKLKGDTAAPAEEMVKADSDVLATKDDPMVADEGAAIATPQASTAQPNNLAPAVRLPQAAEEEHKTPRDRQAKGNGAHVAVNESATTNEAPDHHHHHNQAHRSEHPSKAAGEWYYGHAESQRQFGPVPVDKIKQLLAEGQLHSRSPVWKEGMPNWIPIAHAPEFSTSPRRRRSSSKLKTAVTAVTAANAITAVTALDPTEPKKSRRRRVKTAATGDETEPPADE